jgi:hypothetical protein
MRSLVLVISAKELKVNLDKYSLEDLVTKPQCVKCKMLVVWVFKINFHGSEGEYPYCQDCYYGQLGDSAQWKKIRTVSYPKDYWDK